MRSLVGVVLLACLAGAARSAAQTPSGVPGPGGDSQALQQRQAEGSPWYYGGSVTVSFSGATRVGLFPLVGYKATRELSLGAKMGLEYVSYSGFSATNYAAGAFARYRFVPQAYAHSEFQYVNFEQPVVNGSTRTWIPFLLLGGGFVQPVGDRSSAYVEVLFDVLQDSGSPYRDWQPVINVGVGVGF